jgi:hypothetical protein
MSDIFDFLIHWRQDSQISELRRRLDSQAAARTRAATDPERNLAAAVVRLLVKKGIITPAEIADEMEAIEAEQFAQIGNFILGDGASSSAAAIDAAKIAQLDTSAADSAADIKLDSK